MSRSSPAKPSAELIQKAFTALQEIRTNRLDAKNQIQDLINRRDELTDEIRKMGEEAGARRKNKSDELVQCILEIDYQRKRSKRLADQFEKVIGDAQQGKLWDEAIETDFDKATLFTASKDKAGDDDGGDAPDGGEGEGDPEGDLDEEDAGKKPQSSAKNVAGAAAPVGVPKPVREGWRLTFETSDRSVGELTEHGVPDRAVAALRRAGIKTLAQLAAPLPDAVPGHFGRLTQINGITPGDEAAIEKAVAALADNPHRFSFPSGFTIQPIGRSKAAASIVQCRTLAELQSQIEKTLEGSAFAFRMSGPRDGVVSIKNKDVLTVHQG